MYFFVVINGEMVHFDRKKEKERKKQDKYYEAV